MTFEQWLIETGYNTLYASVIDAMELAWNAAKQHGYIGRGDSDHRDTTTQNVHTRSANKGPLPPPVVDFSTDQCPRCGEVLNQCKCPQVLQRVDFGNEELEAENKQLKAQLKSAIKKCGILRTELEKAKCCGSCKSCENGSCAESICVHQSFELAEVVDVDSCCDKWEVRE